MLRPNKLVTFRYWLWRGALLLSPRKECAPLCATARAMILRALHGLIDSIVFGPLGHRHCVPTGNKLSIATDKALNWMVLSLHCHLCATLIGCKFKPDSTIHCQSVSDWFNWANKLQLSPLQRIGCCARAMFLMCALGASSSFCQLICQLELGPRQT